MTEKMATLTSSSMRVKPRAPSPRVIRLLPFQIRHDGDGARPSPMLPRHRDPGFAQPRLAELGGFDVPSDVAILLDEAARRAPGDDRALCLQVPELLLEQRQRPRVLGGVPEGIDGAP